MTSTVTLIAENVRAGLQSPKNIKSVINVALSLAALTEDTDHQQIQMIGDELLAELGRRKQLTDAGILQ